MKTTDLRAKARAIFGPANPEPMPKQPNAAKALQQRANARPIPTYKDGGAIKKPVLSAAERKMGDALMMTKKGKDVMAYQDRMESDKAKADAEKRKRADKLLGVTAKKDGGKACGAYKDGGKPKKDGLAVMIAIGKAKPEKKAMGGRLKANMDNPKIKAAMDKAAAGLSAAASTTPPRGGFLGKMLSKATPDQRAKLEAGMEQKAAPGGFLGKMMNSPKGRAMVEGAAAKAGVPVKRAVGGAGKMRKGMCDKPVKKAQGGAGKVRKGMMTPEGKITHAMNKMRG